MQKHLATTSKEIGLDKRFLQPAATLRNRCRRIVAPKGAGSSPVGHPSVCRKNARPSQRAEPRLLQSYSNPSTQSLVSIASASLSPIGAFLGPPHAGNPVETAGASDQALAPGRR